MLPFPGSMLKQVGKYQIVEKIGVGGFGSVFKGRDPFIKRLVAIKTCQSEEEEIKKRFFREAEFAGNLQHRNITTIYDFGVTDDGVPYIVQEFLTGEDLDRTIKRKDAMPVGRKVRILLDVCEGLGYAHTAGIIHRDIKPANIRVLEDGTIKIMDFGIAKSMVSQSTLTQTGITLGTASYLAPEQIRGEPVDPRTDIFSLGVLAYELLTHQKPFGGDHISTVLYKILNETPGRPSDVDQSVPQSLESLVMRCLEKNRENRPSSCLEIRDELQSIADRLSGATSMSASQQQSYTGDEATIVAPDGASAFFPGAARPDAGSDLPPRDLFTKGSRQEAASRADHTPPPRTGGALAGSASMPLTTSSRQPTANVGNVTVGGAGGMGSDRTGSRTSGGGGGGGVKDAPISRPAARPHAQSEVGQMSLRPAPPTFGVSPSPPPDEKKSALGIFLAAAVLVLGAGGAAVYLLVIKPQAQSSGTEQPVPTPAPAPPETSASLATATEEPTPATESAKTTTKPVPTAAPVVKATEPAPVVV
ncbi:MAG: protein kinase, partial [Acidobacteria bacterium]|nr:protein kinase [Acidobacteriota bacterium]